MRRGEVWWADYPSPQRRHPVVLLSWDADFNFRDHLTVARVTTTIRDLDTEVRLSRRDGMPRDCVVNLDAMITIRRHLLVERICALPPGRIDEINRAIHLALGMSLPCAVR